MPEYFKAQPVGDEPVASLAIIFTETIPDTKDWPDKNWQQRVAQLYTDQGNGIEHDLFLVLPGGTYDALLRKMLERRASLLRVRFE